MEQERRHSELLEAVQSLAPHYRQAVVLRYFGELNYREIAETLDVPEKTVKSRLFTARRLLAEALAQKGMTG
jgi:RNA polymerase sigma-70 factor (ECF subfamily)